MEYYAAIKKGTFTICNSVDGTGEHYAKLSKPVGERKISYDLTHMWAIMMNENRFRDKWQGRGS